MRNNEIPEIHNITQIFTVGDSHARILTATLRSLVGPNITVTNLWTYENNDGHYHGCNYFWDVTCTLFMVCAGNVGHVCVVEFGMLVFIVARELRSGTCFVWREHVKTVYLYYCALHRYEPHRCRETADNYSMWDKFGFGYIQSCATKRKFVKLMCWQKSPVQIDCKIKIKLAHFLKLLDKFENTSTAVVFMLYYNYYLCCSVHTDSSCDSSAMSRDNTCLVLMVHSVLQFTFFYFF